MATFTATPKIDISIDCLETTDRWNAFDHWIEAEFGRRRSEMLPLDRRGGCRGILDIPEAEKVVEWLKAHGVEPRK